MGTVFITMPRKKKSLEVCPVTEKGGDPDLVSPSVTVSPVEVAYQAWQSQFTSQDDPIPLWGNLTTLEQRGFLAVAESLDAGRAPVTSFDQLYLSARKG